VCNAAGYFGCIQENGLARSFFEILLDELSNVIPKWKIFQASKSMTNANQDIGNTLEKV
jgi:hypothetical protein